MSEIRVLVGTTDFERSSAFYRDVLGFAVAEHWDDPDGRGTLFQATDGAVIEVVEDTPHHPYTAPSGVTVAIEVSDADAVHERLRDASVGIVDPIADRPWGHRSFEICDPSGLPLVFFTPVRAATGGHHDG